MPTLFRSAGYVIWQTNQRVDSALLQDIGTLAERSLWDGLANNLFGDQRGFIGDGFKPAKGAGDLDYTIQAGMGLGVRQTASDPFEADRIPFYSNSIVLGSADAHDPADPRIDIITVTPATVDDENQSLKILVGGSLVPQPFDTRRTRIATINYIAGTPAASPVAPAVPAGDELIATMSIPATSGPMTVIDSRARTGVASSATRPRAYRWVPTVISPKVSDRKTITGVIQDLEGNALGAGILTDGVKYFECVVTLRDADPDNALALIQNIPTGGNESLLGNARVIAQADSATGVLAITVEDPVGGYVDNMFLQVTPVNYFDGTTEQTTKGGTLSGVGYPTNIKIDFSS